MSYALSRVVPRNITRVKRIAKQLHDFYPRQPLSICQATTAHLYGHKDWHALEEAIKNRAAPGPFDYDLEPEALSRRRRAQRKIICRELGDVDPDVSHCRPSDPPSKSTLTYKELGTHILAREAQKGERLAKSDARWNVLFAADVINEIQVTAEKPPGSFAYLDFLTLYSSEQIQALPAALGQWWSVNIPHQPEVAEAIRTVALDPHRATSLMAFGRHWGTLCVYYAETINWTMAMGVAFILAERYGSLVVQELEEFHDLLSSESEPLEEQLAASTPVFLEQSSWAKDTYFECYPRDDFADVFKSQPDSFEESAKNVIQILSNPESKYGTWADHG